MRNNQKYWENRIANKTWSTYNDLEQKNKALLEMYQEASLNISDELYRLAEKMKTSTPMLSDMHKFNRLTGLQKNMEKIIRDLGEKVEVFGKENMQQGFKDTYSNVMVQMGQLEFDEVPQKVMGEMLDRPWLGSNFSKRLWKNTQVLATNLNDILTNGLTQGKTVTEMAIQLNNAMNTGFNICHRLIRTETMHYLNESAFKGYVDAGCKEVEFWAAQDERTCPHCGVMHGKKYKIDKRPILPLHALCRCTYLPIIDLDDKKEDKQNQSIDEIKSYNELEKYLNKNLGIKTITDEVKSLDIEAIKGTCKSMEKVYNDFPVLKNYLSKLYSSNSGIMSCGPVNNFKSVKISFNPKYYNKIDDIIKTYNDCTIVKDTGYTFHPRNTTYDISGVHELGHAIEAYLINNMPELKYDVQKSQYWNDCTIAKNIVSQACKNAKKLPEGKGLKNYNLKANISEYALSDASECMAEAFADYYGNGDKASILSKEIMKIVKGMIK